MPKALKWILMAALVFCCMAVTGCSQAKVDGSSPKVASVSFDCGGTRTESSQCARIKITFDQQVSVSSGVASDFEVKLNGSPVDDGAIKVEATGSANAVTLTLSPAAAGSKGQLFALYQASIEVSAARSDGALPSVTGSAGSAAVLEESINGTLPSGLAINVVDSREGSAATGQVAQATFEVTSPAQIRAITWFSLDGGQTKLLKHNHNFDQATAEDCAADLASVINASQSGFTATAKGAVVDVRANQVVDGQVIDPVVVEGVGVTGGTYSAADGQGN